MLMTLTIIRLLILKRSWLTFYPDIACESRVQLLRKDKKDFGFYGLWSGLGHIGNAEAWKDPSLHAGSKSCELGALIQTLVQSGRRYVLPYPSRKSIPPRPVFRIMPKVKHAYQRVRD